MIWKVGDSVISNLGIDKEKHLTITEISYREGNPTLWFSDGGCTRVEEIMEGDLRHSSWKERYGGKK